jgi:hypothetical protein
MVLQVSEFILQNSLHLRFKGAFCLEGNRIFEFIKIRLVF